ncbi:LA2681 family HEPN domain-containing protein [Burkholderia gladioli]|uniref:LA2681 family HEPN domain-containing protein n=1 Tax=Burkholderia gladioli TaxID=28095 RepID=UPI0039BF0572
MAQRARTVRRLPKRAQRGLFSLSRDLSAPDLQVVAQPDAKELADIRNHLEHKHLKLVEMLVRRRTADSMRIISLTSPN